MIVSEIVVKAAHLAIEIDVRLVVVVLIENGLLEWLGYQVGEWRKGSVMLSFQAL